MNFLSARGAPDLELAGIRVSSARDLRPSKCAAADSPRGANQVTLAASAPSARRVGLQWSAVGVLTPERSRAGTRMRW